MNELFENSKKVRAAIARVAHTTTKRVALMESYTENDTLVVSAVISKLLAPVYGDENVYGNPDNWTRFVVFGLPFGNRLEAVIDRR